MNALICLVILAVLFLTAAGFFLGMFYLLPGSLQRSILRYVDNEGVEVYVREAEPAMLPERGKPRYKMEA